MRGCRFGGRREPGHDVLAQGLYSPDIALP